MTMQTAKQLSVTVIVTLSALLTLTACGAETGPEGDSSPAPGLSDTTQTPEPPESAAAPEEGESPEAAQSEGAIGIELPDDFPADVPLLDGRITSVEVFPDIGAKHWRVHVDVDDRAQATLKARDDLIAAGFEEVAWDDARPKGDFVMGSHEVTIMEMQDIEAGDLVAYFVSTQMDD